MQTFMDRLRGLREDNDLSQEDIARLLGTSQTMYSRYERGVTDIPGRHLKTLCDFFNVSSDYLLCIQLDDHRKPKKAKYRL